MLGFLNIDKQPGMTSHDVVAHIRKITGIKQVGHAGTLDHAASGVLPIAIGSACRLMRFLPTEKIYLADFMFGIKTTTDDLEGELLEKIPLRSSITIEEIRSHLTDFLGEQLQKPPLYSAVHHQGQRLYQLAKAGHVPKDIKLRAVRIDTLELLSLDLPIAKVKIECSAGTYVRSIARDLGEKMGCGAAVSRLQRTRSGCFYIDQAWSLSAIRELAQAGRLSEVLLNPLDVLNINVINISDVEADILRAGQSLSITSALPPGHEDVKLYTAASGNLIVALCQLGSDKKLYPEVVITHAQSLA